MDVAWCHDHHSEPRHPMLDNYPLCTWTPVLQPEDLLYGRVQGNTGILYVHDQHFEEKRVILNIPQHQSTSLSRQVRTKLAPMEHYSTIRHQFIEMILPQKLMQNGTASALTVGSSSLETR